MNKLVLEKDATLFRRENGIGSDDPISLKSFLSKLNIVTLFKPLGDKFSGMAIKITGGDEIVRFMLVNSNNSKGKQHFTICHELYHLYIQKDFSSEICNTMNFERRAGEEFKADLFASYLLLPEDGIKSLIPDDELRKDKITLKTILKIEHYYSCSRTALLYRLQNLDLISRDTYLKFRINVKRSAIEYGYNTGLYESGNENLVIGNYGTIARELFENGKISETHYLMLLTELGMNENELEKLFNGEEDQNNTH